MSREAELIKICVVAARNLRGTKGDVITCLAKAEFNSQSIGESPKIEASADVETIFNFTVSISCNFEENILEDIANKPVMLTISEFLPKEKKQREEKSSILGQCTIDLLPLFSYGVTSHSETYIINPVSGSPLENMPPETPKPEIDVSISVAHPLISEGEDNVMSITLESLYSPPDSWNPSNQQFSYVFALSLPGSEEKDKSVKFQNGVLKAGSDRENANKQIRWTALPANCQGLSTYIFNRHAPEGFPLAEEDGEMKDSNHAEFRTEAESHKHRVTWNMQRRTYLKPVAAIKLQKQIAKSRYLPCEVGRVQAAKEAKSGKKEDDAQQSFRGLVCLNFAKLLYPGVKKVRGAFKVLPFSEQEFHEKTKKGSEVDETIVESITTPPPKPSTGKEDSKKKLNISSNKNTIKDEEEHGFDPEAQQYLDACSYVVAEIELNKPLIPKKLPEDLAQLVQEYIPPRPRFPKRINGASKAVEEYHSQIISVVNLVLEQYRDLFSEDLSTNKRDQSTEAMKSRYQKLIYELNTSGKYFSFKEQLKHSVIKIVREKYFKSTAFENKEDQQKFLSELYVFLVDEMHKGLGKVLNLQDQTPVPDPPMDAAQLKHFAKEAEVNGDMSLADKYYKERIARSKRNADHWFDYACFNLLLGDVKKAIECTKSCIELDQQHMNGLLMYGVLMIMEEKFDAAEVFVEAVTNFYPGNIVGWTVLGLLYDSIGNDIGCEMAFEEANKLNVAQTFNKTSGEPSHADTVLQNVNQTETTLEKSSFGVTAEVTLEPLVEQNTTEISGFEKKEASFSKVKTTSASASKTLNSTLEPSKPPSQQTRDPKRRGTAPKEHSSPATPEPVPASPVTEKSVLLQTVEFLLDINAIKMADKTLAFELTSNKNVQLDYYMALTRLKIQIKNYDEALAAIQTAIQIDFKNPNIWSLCGHVHYLNGSKEQARVAYERVLAYAPCYDMHSIYIRLANLYLEEKKYNDAKNIFLAACRDSPTCNSWLGVGAACYRLDQLAEAEDALCEANILNNQAPEVWAYLSLMCLKTGRVFEAEQSYKYAIKVGLSDEKLLDEISNLQKEVGFGNPAV